MSSVPDPDSVKMFVGQIPRTMEDDELKQIMEEYGPVYQLAIIRDRASGQHRGECVCVCSVLTQIHLVTTCICCAVLCLIELIKNSGFTSHPTQNRSFRRRSSHPVAWLSTEEPYN